MTVEQRELTCMWWNKMRPLINKFVRETILSGFDKDDLRQECYMLINKAVVSYDRECNVPFESYYKIMLYGWRSNQNKKYKLVFLGEESVLREEKDTSIDIEKDVERRVLWEEVIARINKLDDIEKEIILGYYLENKSIKEIASKLGATYKNIEYKKGVILKKLKQYMDRKDIENVKGIH